jgi:hypothetical protein
MKVLIIGFSVVEQKDGICKAIKEIDSPELEDIIFDFCGMGGHHIETISYLFSDILTRNRYDVVLLDLTSSSVRHNLNVTQFEIHLRAILKNIQMFDIQAGLLHFYRKDIINYDQDTLIDLCYNIAHEFDVPSLNLCQLVHKIYSVDEIEILFKDIVHTTSKGSKLYAQEILQFVKKSFSKSKTFDINIVYEPEFLAVPIKNYLVNPDLEVFSLKRHGIEFQCVCFNENREITIELDSKYQLDGIMAVIGPLSGTFEIISESGTKNIVTPYDQYAYYERLHFFSLKSKLTDRFTFIQLPGIPSIELIKGEKNINKRVGKISHLLLSPKMSEICKSLISNLNQIIT